MHFYFTFFTFYFILPSNQEENGRRNFRTLFDFHTTACHALGCSLRCCYLCFWIKQFQLSIGFIYSIHLQNFLNKRIPRAHASGLYENRLHLHVCCIATSFAFSNALCVKVELKNVSTLGSVGQTKDQLQFSRIT